MSESTDMTIMRYKCLAENEIAMETTAIKLLLCGQLSFKSQSQVQFNSNRHRKS